MRVNRGLYVAVFLLFVAFMLWAPRVEAASQYKIKINKQKNTVTVYKNMDGKYKAVKAFICSTGDNTPIGTFSLQERYKWHALVQSMYGQYCVRITGHILFHSVPYSRMNPAKMYAAEFNKLGKKASHGCIRLTVKDSRWIYKNCPRGTKIVIYNGKKAGPLGKPAMVKLPVKKKYSYDPTDKWYPKNPYNNKKPTIKGAKKKTIQQGDADYDILSGIKVKNSVGKNAKKLLQVTVKYRPDKKTPYEVTNAVDTDIAGYYKITYKIIDQLGRTAKVTVVHRVVKPKNDEDGGDVVSPPALSRLGTGMDMHLMNFDIYKEYIMEPERSGLFI